MVRKSLSIAIRLRKRGIPFLPKIIRMFNRVIFSCDIPPEANIDESVVFAHHGLGVVINPNSKIGKDTKILHNVTIGGNGNSRVYKGNKIVAPIIGNNVLIGAGSIIIGPIIIEDNVKIGAGSVVTKDIMENTTVVGPAASSLRQK